MEKDSVQQGSANIREAEGAIAPMSGGVATTGEASGSNVQGAREEQRAVPGSQASDSGTSAIDPLPVGHTAQERTSSPASQRPAEEVSAEVVGHSIQSSEIRGASPSNTPATHQDERAMSNDSNNGSASTEHTVVQIAAPSADQARNSSTPPMVVPIVNILPSTPSQNSMAETSAWGQRSRSSSPFAHAPPSNVPMPAPQPIQPIYYAAPTPMYTTDASGAPIPFTASPAGTPPPVQYVVMPSASPPGSPGPYVQMINGQAMLVQPLPSPVMTHQPAHSTPPAVPTQSQLQAIARPSNQPSQSRRSTDEVPPEVPPKPPALSRASTSATPHLYLPTPINHTITTHLNTPVPLQQPSSSDNIPPTTTNLEMPGAFPLNADQPSGLPLHTPSRRQPRRLSWDDSVYDPPPSAQGRRTVASPLNSPILNIPPLTGIGSGAYPPFSPTPMDGSGSNGRDGYFPAYTNGTGNGTGNGNGTGRADVRVPRRAYSQSSNGRQAISLNDPGPSNLERMPPSRVNSATYSNQRRHGSGVDLSQVPVRHSTGGLQDDTTSVTVGSTGEGVTRGLSFMALFPWMRRSRPEPKRQTSELVDQLSGETREKTIGERLLPTLIAAEDELRKAKVHAKATGWSLNIAIGAQVVLGALTTGVAAATTGHQTSIATTVLGGLSTLAASYLAKTRSSNEPEASAIRCQSLKEFVRDLQYLRLDRGHLTGHDWEVDSFRKRFEDIMKNNQGGLKVMGEFMKEKVREHVTERVKEHVGNDVPVSWSEAKEQAYKQADQVHQQELEQWRRKGGAPVSGSGTTATAGGSKDVARREETHEKPEGRRQSTQHG